MNVIDTIIFWVMCLTTFLLGYVVGSRAVTKDKIKTLYRTVKAGNKPTKGVVRKLTPYERKIKGTVQAETEKAIEETLDELL